MTISDNMIINKNINKPGIHIHIGSIDSWDTKGLINPVSSGDRELSLFWAIGLLIEGELATGRVEVDVTLIKVDWI